MSAVDLRPAGDRALLVTPARHDQLGAFVDLLREAALPGVEDFLPAAETVLLTLTADADHAVLRPAVRGLLARAANTQAQAGEEHQEVSIVVRYDGEDLAEVAELLGMTPEELIGWHTGQVWTCRFIGFAAGFGYLESAGNDLTVPRRAQSRTAVPAGSVALADGFSAVYPRRSPGGWQLIGHTDAAMWDLSRPRPALLTAGTRVRFVQEGP